MADAQQGLGDEAGAMTSFGISVALRPNSGNAGQSDEQETEKQAGSEPEEPPDNGSEQGSLPERVRMGRDQDNKRYGAGGRAG